MKKTTMSVREMGTSLGLKKVESYWLVHKNYFETITVNGKMRVVIKSFEAWYNSQHHYRKVNGAPPKPNYYTIGQLAEMLGLNKATVNDLVKKNRFPYKLVNGAYQINKAGFEKWYATQDHYIKVSERVPDPKHIALDDARADDMKIDVLMRKRFAQYEKEREKGGE